MTDSKRIDRKDAEVLGTLTATVSMALDSLSDVVAPTPSADDVLTWDSGTSKWVNKASSGGTPTAITVADESSDTQCYPAFFTAATGDLGPKTDASALTYNASTGALGATTFVGALTGNADTATTASAVSGVSLEDLDDVTVTSAASGEFLGWNGTEWVNEPRPGGAGAGVIQLFMDDTAIRPISANNSYEVCTLSTTPVTGTGEVVDTVTANANTVLGEAYLYDTEIGGASIEGGVWDFTVWRSASSSAQTSELLFNVHRVISGGATTGTVTGSSTSRTFTASGGTPFDAGDASATISDCGFVMTPLGLYPITARTSATEVTITTPSGYANESGVAFSVWSKLFQATTGDINDTTPAYTRQEILSAQAAFTSTSTDKIGWIVFGKTTRTSNTGISWTHNGTARYTHMHTPLVLRHNDLAGLQGGTTAQYYHLTSAQATSVGSAAAAYSALRFNGLADAQVLTSAADTTTTLDGTYASDLLITGTAVMQIYNLGTATAYRNGKRFTFYNGTPEFVGVLNSDSTVWHRVPPRGSVMCVLGDNSTAAGVWFSELFDPAVSDSSYGLHYAHDCASLLSSSNAYAESTLTAAVSGAGAAVSYGVVSQGGKQGTLIVNTGTTIAGYALNYWGPPGVNNYLGSGCRAYENLQSISAISSAADEYIARYGIGNNITGGAHTEGAYFLYDRLNSGVNWQFKTIKTAGGAASTTTDTGLAPIYGTTGAEWQKLRCEISSDGSRADAWIDKVLVTPAGGNGNLPAVTTSIKIAHMGITKTEDAGVNARYLKVDFYRVQSYPLALR